jgi:tripeptidyl-peptidase-1
LFSPSQSGKNLTKVIGPNNENSPTGEGSLDVQYITAIGKNIPTEYWSFPGRQPGNIENEPFLDWLILLGNTTNPPLVFSVSYGEDENSISLGYANRMNQEFAKAGVRGITILFASGDSGVGSIFTSCTKFAPQYPASSPFVTSVGGTTTCANNVEVGVYFSSGGFSERWSRPIWQNVSVTKYLSNPLSNLVPSFSLFNSSGRAMPDISTLAENYKIVIGGKLYIVSGTSCSAPMMGGIVGLINDKRKQSGMPPMGFINPFLYLNFDLFNDIIAGNNPGCGSNGFSAVPGWDPVTGLGTPKFDRLLNTALRPL